MGTKAGAIQIDLELNNKKFDSQLNNTDRIVNAAGNKISGALKKIGAAVIAAFSVSAIKNFGQNLIEQAAKVNASNSQFTQTFKALESEARASISEVAKESGILETRLQGAGSQIYSFAKSSGMDSVQSLDMMKDALQIAADSAAYYDRSLEDTTESLRSFLKGNYANDAALGVSATETTRNAAANRLYGQSFMDLSEAQKQLVLLDMVKQANAASGAMGQAAREADGWENVTGNLKEAWNQLLAAIGKPVLQGAIGVVKTLTAWIEKLAQWAKAASSVLGDLFGWNTDDETAQTAIDTAKTATSIADSVDNQNNLTKAVAATNAEVKRGVANFDKLNIISKSTTGNTDNGNKANSGNNLGKALSNNYVGTVDVDTGKADNKIAELKKKLLKVFAPFVEFYNKYIKPIVDKVKKKIDEWKAIIKKWWDDLNLQPLIDSVNDLLKNLQPLVDVLIDKIGWVLKTVILPIVKDFVEVYLPVIIDVIGHIIAGLTPVIDGLFKIIQLLWENIIKPALDKIKEWFQKTGEKIGPKLEELGEKIGKLFYKLAPIVEVLSVILGPAIEGILDIIGGHTMQSLENLIDTIGDIVDALSGLADFLTGAFTDDWGKAWTGLSNFAIGIVNVLIDKLNQLWSGLYATVASIGNAIGGLIKGLGSLFGQEWGWEMPSQAPLIPHVEYDVYSSPSHGSSKSFATGGIVKAPTLAVVGDNPGANSGNPEVIAPLNKLQGMINESKGEDVIILTKIFDLLQRIYELFVAHKNQGGNLFEFIANLNGNEIFREMVRQNDMYKASHNGKSAFA